MSGRTIEVGGRPVFAGTGGGGFDPDRPTVVLVHGAGMDHTVWAMQARWLAHHARNVLALDLPGHGASPGPGLASIAAMGDLILGAIEASGARGPVRLAGHSMGALAVLEAAARGGARIDALLLAGFTPLMPVHPDLLAAAAVAGSAAPRAMTSWAVGRHAQMGGHEASGIWLTATALRLLERSDPASLAGDLAACDAYRDAEAAARRVTCPALLLLGADDRMTPAAKAAPFVRCFAQGRVETLPGAGHMLMMEQPTAALAAMRTLL